MKKIIIFNILIISLIVLFLEILLRLFSDMTPQGVSKGIINKDSSNPNFNYSNVDKGRVFGSRVFTNDSGFRISQGTVSSVDNFNVYFIGGSVTFGNGIDQSETFTGILNEKFKKINIHNASVIGSDIKNNYYILKEKIKKDKVKKIFVSFSLDDLDGVPRDLNNSSKIQNKNSFIQKLKRNTILTKINNFIRSKSVIYVWTKGTIFNAEKKYYDYSLNAFKNEKNLEYLKKYLDLIKVYDEETNNKIKFIILPYSHQTKGNNCKKNDLAEKLMEYHLIKRKFDYLKVKDLFCEDKQKNKIFLKHDPAHLSKYGHKSLADILYNHIQ
jgi:hypothetical protein